MSFERTVIKGFSGEYHYKHQKTLDSNRTLYKKVYRKNFIEVCKGRKIPIYSLKVSWLLQTTKNKSYKKYLLFTLSEAIKYSMLNRLELFKLLHEMKVEDLHDQVSKITFKVLLEIG